MLELETAVARILAALPPPQRETILIGEAATRVSFDPIVAPLDLPMFANSSMDGYAVRAAEVQAARQEAPARLRLRTRISAGDSFAGTLDAGECARVFTGAPMPGGADAVVMQEDCEMTNDAVLICDAVKPGQNVRQQGEDVRRGARLVEPGTKLTAGSIGLIGALGLGSITVGRRPVVGLVATGSELREPGAVLAPGQIYESNRAMIAALVTQAGGMTKQYPLVPDTLEATRQVLERAFTECDIVVTSGGVSVGELDFVKAAFEAEGGTLQFWKVAMRPGKPFVFGQRRDHFLFGLPGNPVSAFVTFLLLVRPALQRWQGAAQFSLPEQRGELAESISNSSDRRHFVRVRFGESDQVYSAGLQASHALAALAQATGLLDLAPGCRLAAGTTVRVLRLG